jgi:hypothetical protein
MTSKEYEDIIWEHSRLRSLARILGTIEAAFLFYVAFTEFNEEIDNHSLSPLMTAINGEYFLTGTMTIAFMGLIIAYWKEGLGGGISLVSYIVLFTGALISDFHAIFIIFAVLAILPSVLYLAFWLAVYLDLKKLKQDQTE